MKSKLLAVLFLAGTAAFAGPRVFVGVGVGYPPAPVVAYAPPPVPRAAFVPAPRPGFTWVSGYYYPVGRGWGWRAGYWARPPYARSYWVAPRFSGGRYYGGYWRR